ncbi:Nucleic acid-binding protein [Corchorus olitorius]|uniref:Nucleic acid-binding protein n=1 Tax=Corchorus olitorius TaxID=93759 RepID=A0A1R3H4N3_9ROSI|nr:Nucleic acid-binding protein [Corchorus olitorius]
MEAGIPIDEIALLPESKLSQLRDGGQKCAIVIKILRLWDSIIPPKNIFAGLDFLAADSEEITEGTSKFPPRHFRFTDYHEIMARNEKLYYLTDIIGVLGSATDVKAIELQNNQGTVDKRDIFLTLLSGDKIKITIWDPKIMDLNITGIIRLEYKPVLALAGIYIKDGTNIPEAVEIRKRLHRIPDDGKPIELISISDVDALNQFTYTDVVEKTIKDLLFMNPVVIKGVKLKVKGQVLRFQTKQGWYYNSCPDCTLAVSRRPSGYHCNKHGDTPVAKMRVKVVSYNPPAEAGRNGLVSTDCLIDVPVSGCTRGTITLSGCSDGFPVAPPALCHSVGSCSDGGCSSLPQPYLQGDLIPGGASVDLVDVPVVFCSSPTLEDIEGGSSTLADSHNGLPVVPRALCHSGWSDVIPGGSLADLVDVHVGVCSSPIVENIAVGISPIVLPRHRSGRLACKSSLGFKRKVPGRTPVAAHRRQNGSQTVLPFTRRSSRLAGLTSSPPPAVSASHSLSSSETPADPGQLHVQQRSFVGPDGDVTTAGVVEGSSYHVSPVDAISCGHCIGGPSGVGLGNGDLSCQFISAHSGRCFEPHDVGGPVVVCRCCGAYMWAEEASGKKSPSLGPVFIMCCKKGMISLPPRRPAPFILDQLLDPKGGPLSRTFRENLRLYNSYFQFTSLGGKIDNSVNATPRPFIFKLNNQTYHKIGPLLPAGGRIPQFAQLYIYDCANEVTNRVTAVTSRSSVDDVNRVIIEALIQMLDAENEVVKLFRTARERIEADGDKAVHIRLLNSRSSYPRTYLPPTSNQIGGLIVGDFGRSNGDRDVIVEHKDGVLKRISTVHPLYMALQHPILFPYGQDGFTPHIRYVQSPVKDINVRKTLSMREYYSYQMQQRRHDGEVFLRGGRLFQQYCVDVFSSIQEGELHWLEDHQSDIMADLYTNVRDVVNRGDVDVSSVGKRVILPASFTGSPRYLYQKYQDAMAIWSFGYPQLFITFTCNSNWPELKEALDFYPGLRPEDRPDLVARVFHIKLRSLIDDLFKRSFFGPALAGMFTLNGYCVIVA